MAEDLWLKSHQFILNSNVNDFYESGGYRNVVVKRTARKIHFSNGDVVTISKSKYGFFHLTGKNVNQIIRDIEGYLLLLKHQVFSI